MAKINNMFDILQSGIKAESLRQKTIAKNLSNIQTPNYKTVDVKFEALLKEAMESGSIKAEDIAPELYSPANTPIKSNGNDVSLDEEVVKMVKNTLKHKAYIRMLNKKFEQIDMAISIR